jgi:hypothetical protein
MTSESRRLTTDLTLSEFFKDEIDLAIKAQALDASEEVGFYLVNLLQAYTKAERVPDLDEPLALKLERATFSPQNIRIKAFRHLGDVSLYLAGLFSASLRSRTIDVGYAIRMGSGAYAKVATLQRRRYQIGALAAMYLEMSEKFSELVEVLTQVRERHSLGADAMDLAEIYERWSRSKAPHLWERMSALGVLPSAEAYLMCNSKVQ